MVKRRGGSDGSDEAEGMRWMATYGDVVTLLLAFFVLLYAISQVDQAKFQLFVSGLEVPFGNASGSAGLLGGENGLANASDGSGALPADASLNNIDNTGLIDGGAQVPSVATTTTVASSTDTTVLITTTTVVIPPISIPDPDLIDTARELEILRDQVSSDLAAAGFENEVDLIIDARGLVIAVATDDVLFSSGSSGLSGDGLGIVEVIAPSLTQFNNELLIEGHTDDIPLTRAGYDNWNLSSDRALAVLRLLEEEFGISPARMATTGYGEHRPRADNTTEEGRAQNRRVELVIVAETG